MSAPHCFACASCASAANKSRLEEVTVHGAPLELVLLAKYCQAVSDRRFDLWLEAGVLCEESVVSFCGRCGMLVHVLDFRVWHVACSHESGRTGRQLCELV